MGHFSVSMGQRLGVHPLYDRCHDGDVDLFDLVQLNGVM